MSPAKKTTHMAAEQTLGNLGVVPVDLSSAEMATMGGFLHKFGESREMWQDAGCTHLTEPNSANTLVHKLRHTHIFSYVHIYKYAHAYRHT